MATDNKNNAANEAAKKALEAVNAKKAAEKKKVEHTYTQVGQQSTNKEELLAITKQNARPYRIAAFILWALAIACEVFAVLIFFHKVEFKFTTENPGWTIAWIALLVLDLILVIIASRLWVKANHLDPAPATNKTKFWIHNNLGVIISVFAFVPFIILILTNKDADKKSKTLATIVAAVALLIAGVSSADYNPISQEEMLEAADIDTVFWTASGTVFHAYDDCQHLNHTVELLTGTSTTAIENGKTRLCKTCEARALKEAEEIAEKLPGEDKAPETQGEATTAAAGN
ncbi:MAG: hypothetical protein II882_01670 [Lachnospiraceae bacterium]|nr:hypothetical protein [Lachnospiraceae bacterium]